MFWPRDIWGRYAADLEEFKEATNRTAAIHCLNHMVTDALGLLPACITYMSQLKDPRVGGSRQAGTRPHIKLMWSCVVHYSWLMQRPGLCQVMLWLMYAACLVICMWVTCLSPPATVLSRMLSEHMFYLCVLPLPLPHGGVAGRSSASAPSLRSWRWAPTPSATTTARCLRVSGGVWGRVNVSGQVPVLAS
jgi:hypothetical protein